MKFFHLSDLHIGKQLHHYNMSAEQTDILQQILLLARQEMPDAVLIAVPCKNLTSGNADAKVYELIAKSENNITRYEFEPDEEMLDAIMVKYPRLVVK